MQFSFPEPGQYNTTYSIIYSSEGRLDAGIIIDDLRSKEPLGVKSREGETPKLYGLGLGIPSSIGIDCMRYVENLNDIHIVNIDALEDVIRFLNEMHNRSIPGDATLETLDAFFTDTSEIEARLERARASLDWEAILRGLSEEPHPEDQYQ